MQLKVIRRIETKMKYVRSQIKNPYFQGFNLDDTLFIYYSSIFLVVLDDRVDTSSSSLWSSKPPNSTSFFANERWAFSLQPHFYEIELLHPNSSI